jgi:hypothetical protein
VIGREFIGAYKVALQGEWTFGDHRCCFGSAVEFLRNFLQGIAFLNSILLCRAVP